MKLLHIALLLASGLLCGALTVATAQDSTSQGSLPRPPVPRPEIPQLPVPAGLFGVGRIGYEWIDASRSDMHSADPLKHRDLMVYLWYPSPKRESGKLGLYLPGAIQMNADPAVQPAMKAEFESNWPSIVSGAISSHAIEYAPVALGGATLGSVFIWSLAFIFLIVAIFGLAKLSTAHPYSPNG